MEFVRKRQEKENGDLLKKITGSRAGGLMLLFLSGLLIYNVVKSIVITSEKLEILNQAENEVSDLRLNNLELLVLTEYMTSDEYLETEARNRLNLSKKGEVAFVIPEQILEKNISDVESILNSDEETSNTGNCKVWYDFFNTGI